MFCEIRCLFGRLALGVDDDVGDAVLPGIVTPPKYGSLQTS